MTPFRIQCETCQTRLRVREEGFIGEVHACPRCGGMVLIVPPAETGEASAEAPATEVPVASPGEPLNETADQAAAVPLVLGLSETLVPDEIPEGTTTAEPVAAPVNAPVGESIAEAIEAPVTITPSQAIWLKAMAPGLTAAALTLASGALWFVYGGTEEPTPAVAVAADPTVNEPASQETPSETSPIATTVLKPTIEEPPVEIEPAEIEVVPFPEATPVEKAIEKIEPRPTAKEPVRVAVATPPPVKLALAQLPEEFDPLDFDPETIDLVLRRGGVESSPTPKTAEPVEETLDDRTPTVTDRIDARLAEAARSGGVSVRRSPSSEATNHAPAAPADRLLAQTLPEIALKGVPLTDAIQLLSELSGVPLSLCPHELQLAGADAHQEVSITGVDITFGELIAQTLKPIRLAPQTEGPHVFLQRKGVDTQRTVKHRLTDLAGDDPAAFEKLLAQIGPASLPASIKIREGLLSVSGSRRTHYELLLLCERLRVARRLEQQSPYPRRLIATTPALAELHSLLERRTTFSFIQPTRIREVVNHWRRATDLTIWVDWRSLADADLGPLSAIECSATNRPWSEVLDGVLGPLGLAWAAGDGQTLWIASREAIAANQVREFYPVKATVGEAFAERIADEHPTAGVVYDDASHAVIVRGNAMVQRAVHGVWREL